MITNFEQFTKMALKEGGRKTVVVAAAHDEHALEAVFHAREKGIVDCLLVGKGDEIRAISGKLNYAIEKGCILEADTEEECAKTAVTLIREKKGHILMKGKMETKSLLKEVVNKETGIGTDSIMSHMCFLQIPAYHKIVGFTDAGMIMYPDLEQKKGILKNAVDLFHRLGYDRPKVAVAAAVETVNPKMPESVHGAELKKMAETGAFGSCVVEGPISFDLTFSAEAARLKGYESEVTGDADIMIVPDITAGNLMAKALICLAGAKMVGCIIGAKVPIVLSSRSASFEEKYDSLAFCAALEEGR